MRKKILLFLFIMVVSIFGITNTYAVEDKYDGDYTIEYLLRHYNVVTFGTKDRYQYTIVGADLNETNGSVSNVFDIGGPVLIRGDYTGNIDFEYYNEFAQKTNGISSYIKGNVGSNIRPGSKEKDDETDIYVGNSNSISGNKINDNENEYNYTIKQSDNYVDFDKLYAAVVNEQQNIENGEILSPTEEDLIYLDDRIKFDGDHKAYYITIDSPGIYTLENLEKIHMIYIENYNPDELYIININDKYIYRHPIVNIKYSNNQVYSIDDDNIYCGRKDDKETCTGNLIWNYRNARFIHTNYDLKGHIIAPKADIELTESHYPGAILANSISSKYSAHTAIQFYPYNLSAKISEEIVNKNLVEEKETDPDLYDGDYSVESLIRNYSVVTLGQKEYDSRTNFKNSDFFDGSAKIFHIAAQFLISGDLSSTRLDLNYTDYNEEIVSYLRGRLKHNTYQGVHALLIDYTGDPFWRWRLPVTKSPRIFVGSYNSIQGKGAKWYGDYNDYLHYYAWTQTPVIVNSSNSFYTDHSVYISDNYINFNALYKKIIEQQKKIDKGEEKKADTNGNVYLKIGGNYTIKNVSDLKNIIFTNFEENENKLTIITIEEDGNVNFPIVGYGTELSNIPETVSTNDYINGDTLNNRYQRIKYDESYYGNIVWNIPNATYLTLSENAPFIGHIIAPNADMETPELHFAGAVIVNSLYTEGNTEAHFYPLSVDDDLYRKLEIIDISGTKIWDDKDNQDGKRPESITINLLADGEKIDSVTISEENGWKYEFNNLPKLNNGYYGEEINYTITEDSVDHYSTEIDGYDVTNSYTPEKTSLTVNKVWKDEDDKDKIRPRSIEVELYANGKKVDTTELSEENDWTYIFTEIDMNSNGKRIEYAVKEKEVEGYTTEITGNQETGYTIINTHEIKVEEKENPVTYDNIVKFAIISVISTLMLAIGIIIYHKNKKEA